MTREILAQPPLIHSEKIRVYHSSYPLFFNFFFFFVPSFSPTSYSLSGHVIFLHCRCFEHSLRRRDKRKSPVFFKEFISFLYPLYIYIYIYIYMCVCVCVCVCVFVCMCVCILCTCFEVSGSKDRSVLISIDR